MSLLDFTLPPWVSTALKVAPWAIAAAGLGYGLVEHSSYVSLVAENKVALAEQRAADARTSAALLTRQAADLAVVHAQTLTALQRVRNAPVTTNCGPAVRDAARSVRDAHGAGPAKP